MKYGYRLACLVNHVFPQLHSEEGWKKLWHSEVPPKVRSFIWRLCWDFSPSRVQLTHRHIRIPITFVCVCARAHVCVCVFFFFFVNRMWSISGMFFWLVHLLMSVGQ